MAGVSTGISLLKAINSVAVNPLLNQLLFWIDCSPDVDFGDNPWSLDKHNPTRIVLGGDNGDFTDSLPTNPDDVYYHKIRHLAGASGYESKYFANLSDQEVVDITGIPEDVTCSFWMRSETLNLNSGNSLILLSWSLAAGIAIINNSGSQNLVFLTDSGAVVNYDLEDNKVWQFFTFRCFRMNPSQFTIQLYVNAVLVHSTNVGDASFSGGLLNAIIAKDYSVANTASTDVHIDSFCFWNRLLTTEEITTLYHSGNGLSYSTIGSAEPQLMSALVDYWDIPPTNTLLSQKRAILGNSTSSGTTIGVDGVSNSAIGTSSLGNGVVNFYDSNQLSLTGTITIVCWVAGFNNSAILLGDTGNDQSTSGFRGGYNVSANTIVTKNNTTPSSFSLPAVTLPSGDNGFSFLAMNITTATFPSQTVKIYSSSGTELISSTQNFGLSFGNNFGVRRWGSSHSFTIDKVHIFNRVLTSSEIAFLYNSGAGRTYYEIQGQP